MSAVNLSNVPVQQGEKWDVIVAGGGPSGVMAACAAAREGARTLLLEATGALGGMATQGLVPNWCGLSDGKKFIHSGLVGELIEQLHGCDLPADHGWSPLVRGVIDPEKLKRILDDWMDKFGVKVLFQTMLSGVIKDGEGGVDAILISNKAGITALKADVYIDCTGDGDLAAWAGAEFLKGDEDGDMQPVSLCFSISNVGETSGLPENFHNKIIDDEKYPLVKDSFFNLGAKLPGLARNYNSGHQWGVDNTDPESMTKALMDGRRLAKQLHDAYKEHVPEAFKDSIMTATAPLLGVRETRRIICDYYFTREDYVARRRFDDEITFNSFFLDVHPSQKQRQLEKEGKWDWHSKSERVNYEPGEFHGIPYRCLTPKGLRNVLIAGRSISADRPTQGAMRVMPPCMSMGEAVGIAAVMAAKENGCDVHAVNIQKLRSRLRETGSFLPEHVNA